ncbi:MAG: hypothetical protein NTW19_00865 [Planctomycetota bacterium]|nr:hypothetical protein [Planctomycetota bacterium]
MAETPATKPAETVREEDLPIAVFMQDGRVLHGDDTAEQNGGFLVIIRNKAPVAAVRADEVERIEKLGKVIFPAQ